MSTSNDEERNDIVRVGEKQIKSLHWQWEKGGKGENEKTEWLVSKNIDEIIKWQTKIEEKREYKSVKCNKHWIFKAYRNVGMDQNEWWGWLTNSSTRSHYNKLRPNIYYKKKKRIRIMNWIFYFKCPNAYKIYLILMRVNISL